MAFNCVLRSLGLNARANSAIAKKGKDWSSGSLVECGGAGQEEERYRFWLS